MSATKYKNSQEHNFRAKQLRQQASTPERLLWNALCELRKATGLKFRRQHPFHPYVIDFVCMSVRLAIELDGSSHDTQQAYDAASTDFLSKQGWIVIRFTNEDAQKNLSGVIETILGKVRELEILG